MKNLLLIIAAFLIALGVDLFLNRDTFPKNNVDLPANVPPVERIKDNPMPQRVEIVPCPNPEGSCG